MSIEIIKIILEYLKAFLSWLVVIFGLGLFFILKFHDEICVFLRTNRVSKAGPVEFQPKEEEKIGEKIEESLEQKGITLTSDRINQLESEFQSLTNKTVEQEEKLQETTNLLNFLVERAELYESLYLNLFLVPNTKQVLLWASGIGAFTKDLFNAIYSPQIPNTLERESIFNALITNGLISEIGGSFIATEKATKFLKFIGLIK